MTISNITRTNTIDEWRIQTNLSATELNKIETGNYDKTAGFLNVACTAVLQVTSTGTGFSVANNALVGADLTVGKNIALGSEGAATGNLTVGAKTFIYGKDIALFVANSAVVNNSLQATESITTNNFIANSNVSITGTTQIGYLIVNNSTTIATTLTVTGNTTAGNLVTANSVVSATGRFSSNVEAANFIASSGSLVVDNARITNSLTSGPATINGNATITGNTVSGNLTTANATSTGSLRVNNLTETDSNTTGSIFVYGGAGVSKSLFVSGNVTIKGDAQSTVNNKVSLLVGDVVANSAGNLYIYSGDTSTGGAQGSLTLQGNGLISGNLNVGGGIVSTSSTTGAVVINGGLGVSSNINASHINAVNSLTAETLRITSNSNFTKETTASVINATNARITDNANVAHLTASQSVNTNLLRVGTNVSVGEILSVTGNGVFGNVNTSNMIFGGTLRTTGRADIGTSLEVGQNLTVENNLTVGDNLVVEGNFQIQGTVVYDTDVLTISSGTPITVSPDAAYFGVFRGNTIGGVNGTNALAHPDANAYIRWSASSNTWQIRDIFNPITSTSYSKVLTANLISSTLNSTSTEIILNALGANTLNNNIVSANTNMKNYVDVANTNMKNYVDVANTNMKNYVDAANTNLKNYTDSTFVKLSPAASQTISSDITLSGNVTISKNLTISGTVTTVNTEEINLADNEILLNSNYSSSLAPTENAGILVNRGNATNTYLRWNETIDAWVANNGTSSTSEFRLANSTSYLSEGTNLYYTDTRARAAISHTTGSAGYNNSTGVITIPGSSSDISEGNKLFLTAARVRANVNASNISVSATANTTQPLQYDGTNGLFYHAASGVTTSSSAYYGSATQVATFQVSNTGHILAASNVAISISSSSVSGLAASATTNTTDASNISSGTLAAARLPAFSGDLSTTAGSSSTTLATVNSTTGSFGNGSTIPVVTVNGKGLVTSVTTAAVSIASGAVSGLAASATTNALNATNINSGTLSAERLPALPISTNLGTPVLAADLTYYAANTSIAKTGGLNTTWRNAYWPNALGANCSVSFSIDTSATETDSFIGFVGSGYESSAGYSNLLAGIWFNSSTQIYLIEDGNFPTATAISATNTSKFRIEVLGSTAYYYLDNTLLGSRSLSGGSTGVTIGDPLSLVAGLKYVGMGFYNVSATFEGGTTNATYITKGTLASARLGTTETPQFGSLGVGTAASGTTGEIRATNSITAHYSDDRLKTKLGLIENSLAKVMSLNGFYYEANEIAQQLGYEVRKEVGVSAQEVQKVLPEIVVPAPIDSQYLTIHYEKLIPLLVEAIKELKAEIDELKKK